MDIPNSSPIECVEMHTTGEPTRIIINGYPELKGTLLEQRRQAMQEHDHVRRRIILEPRGHFDMCGAILRHHTELTDSGSAHIGVLFVHNEGYSTMCGHATIALGRYLIDTHDLKVFPNRDQVVHDATTATAQLNLHAPCGLLRVTVPVSADGRRSDPTRPVSFVSVPSFASAIDVNIEIPTNFSWSELGARTNVQASVAYGGAFYCLVSPQQLGFPNEVLRSKPNIQRLSHATRSLKDAIIADPRYGKYFAHPESKELSFLYGVVVVDEGFGVPLEPSKGGETGLCFFADQEIDRSPTGSAVAARVALAYARGRRKQGDSWTYHSLVSSARNGRGGFIGTVVEEEPSVQTTASTAFPSIRVQVQGFAYYTGFHTFVVEPEDPIGDDGFLLV